MMPVEHYFGFRKCRDKAARRSGIAAQGGTGFAQYFVNIESVSIDKGLRQKFSGDMKANKTEIGGRRECLAVARSISKANSVRM